MLGAFGAPVPRSLPAVGGLRLQGSLCSAPPRLPVAGLTGRGGLGLARRDKAQDPARQIFKMFGIEKIENF